MRTNSMRAMVFAGCLALPLGLAKGQQTKATAAPREETPASQFDVAGDFEFLISATYHSAAPSVEKPPYCVPEDLLRKEFTAQLRFGNISREATVVGLCRDRAVLEARLESAAAPTSVMIRGKSSGEYASFPYVPGLQYEERKVQFFSSDGDCPRPVAAGPDPELTFYPTGDVKRSRVLGCSDGRLTVKITALPGYVPKTVFVSWGASGSAGAAHTNLKVFQSAPGSTINPSQPNVGFSVVDDESVKANFGKSIADQYVVIDLQVRNPSLRKVQLKKSALWFEVDYRALTKGSATPTRYLFGKDHQFQHAPHDFLTVMGAFDGSASRKERLLKMSDIAITAMAGATIFLSDGATLYPKTIAWIAGIVNPTMRNVLFSEQDEKRRRNQMLTQSFADIIQISPQSSAITKVFLPRKPISSLFKEEVQVDQVRDVHLYLEVVSEMVEEIIAKGQLRLGLTMEQVSVALGFPDTISKANDQTTWRYNTGKFDSLVFNSEAKLIQWTERKLKDQLMQMIGNAKADDVKKILGLEHAPAGVGLKDGAYIWLKPGNVEFDLVFSKAGVLERINDKPPEEFLASLEGSIRIPEAKQVLGHDPKEVRPDRLGGQIWVNVKEKTNFLFDRDNLLANARYNFTDTVLEEQKKSADPNFTRGVFENDLKSTAASLFGDRKAAAEEFNKEVGKAVDACKDKAVCTYPAPESSDLEYKVTFSAEGPSSKFESIVRQTRAAPGAEETKSPAAKAPAAKPPK